MRVLGAILFITLAGCGRPPDACVVDADCVDANPCDGAEICLDGACVEGEAVTCEADDVCRSEDGAAVCGPWCALPRAPNLSILDDEEELRFTGPGTVEVAVVLGTAEPDFEPVAAVGPFEPDQQVTVIARTDAPACSPDDRFELVYDIADAYPGPADTPTSRAVHADDPRVAGWASSVRAYTPGDGLTGEWTDEARALGPADGTSEGVLALGRGGSVVLGIALSDGPGPDLAVFENGFTDGFLEYARVSVSTDGEHFATFDAAAHTPDPVGAFDVSDARDVHGLAGVYRQGFGTPFDLARLRFVEEVRLGFVRLDDIRYVRLDDVVGDGADLDAWGRPIHDPFPTTGSAGFDLDAVAVLVAR